MESLFQHELSRLPRPSRLDEWRHERAAALLEVLRRTDVSGRAVRLLSTCPLDVGVRERSKEGHDVVDLGARERGRSAAGAVERRVRVVRVASKPGRQVVVKLDGGALPRIPARRVRVRSA
jgi:hypothetical protein